MMRLERFEHLLSRRIDRFFQGTAGRGADDLARDLRTALDEVAERIVSAVYVPNSIAVSFAPAAATAMGALAEARRCEVLEALAGHVEHEGYRLLGPLDVRILADERVAAGEIRVALRFEAEGPRSRDESDAAVNRIAGWLFERDGTAHAVPCGGGAIGRGPASAIRLEDPRVSRLHALLEPSGEELRVTDLGSRNGLRYRGREVRRASVASGEAIGLGALTLVWQPEMPCSGGPPE